MILGSGVRIDKQPSSISVTDKPELDWTIRELAMYDFPALVEYVCDATGYDKVCALFSSLHYLIFTERTDSIYWPFSG